MGENTPEFDENDPKTKEKLEFLGKLNANTADLLTSWADMYAHLALVARRYMNDPSKEHADSAVLHMLSFVLALESLPTEGDIVQIGRKMNEIMVLREDLTGAKVFFGEDAESTRKLMALALLQAVAGIAQQATPDPEPVPKANTSGKTLH